MDPSHGADPKIPPDPILGRYRVIETVGAGGMGTVYRGWDERLDRPVAIKGLHPSASLGADERERFLREARAMARLDHPRIARIYEVIAQDGRDFLVQEFLEGEDLAHLLSREGLVEEEWVRRIAVELAEALEVVHARGLVHRDLKPSNVFLVEGRGVCLLDLGLVLDPEATRITMDDVVVGTLHFLSPEMIRGDEVGPPSDVYQFGLVMHVALTGRLLDRSEACPWKELVRLASLQEPQVKVSSELDPSWRALVEACCRKDVATRIADGAALRAIVEGPRETWEARVRQGDASPRGGPLSLRRHGPLGADGRREGGMAAGARRDGALGADGRREGGMAAGARRDGALGADERREGGMAAGARRDGEMATDGRREGEMAAGGRRDGEMATDARRDGEGGGGGSGRPTGRLRPVLLAGLVFLALLGGLALFVRARSGRGPGGDAAPLLLLEDHRLAFLPDGWVWSARGPDGRPGPSWSWRPDDGETITGPCRRVGTRWRAEWAGGQAGGRGRFVLLHGGRVLLDEAGRLPPSPFAEGPVLRCSREGLVASWRLHGKGDCRFSWKVEGGSGGQRVVDGSFRSPSLPPDAFVDWSLDLGARRLAAGRIRAGLRERWTAPEAFGGKKRSLLFVRSRGDGGLHLGLSPGRLFSLRSTEGPRGPGLEIDWVWDGATELARNGGPGRLGLLEILTTGEDELLLVASPPAALFRLRPSRRRAAWAEQVRQGGPAAASSAEESVLHLDERAGETILPVAGETILPVQEKLRHPRFMPWGPGRSLAVDAMTRVKKGAGLLGVLDHSSGALRWSRFGEDTPRGRVVALAGASGRAWFVMGDRRRAWIGHVAESPEGPRLVGLAEKAGGCGGDERGRRRGSVLSVSPDGACAVWVRGARVEVHRVVDGRVRVSEMTLPLGEETWVHDPAWLSTGRCLLPLLSRRAGSPSFVLSVQLADLLLGDDGGRPRLLSLSPHVEVPELYDRPVLTNLHLQGDRFFLGSTGCLLEGRVASPLAWTVRRAESAALERLLPGAGAVWAVVGDGTVRGLDL